MRDGLPVCPVCVAGLAPAPRVAPPPALDAWFAPFAYDGVARELVARIKYRNVRAVVPWLAACMAEAVAAGEVETAVIAWAPTTPVHRRTRGFDPAELLARAVARRLRRPVRGVLTRSPGPPQTGLPAAARRVGPRFTSAHALHLRQCCSSTTSRPRAPRSPPRPRPCAPAARTRVVVLTAARTPRPGSA